MNGAIFSPIVPRNDDKRSIPGFPRLWADRAGHIWNKKDGKELAPFRVAGVLLVDVSPRPSMVDRPWVPVKILVARAWLPRLRPKHRDRVLKHIDNDPLNVAASNLAWVSPPRCSGVSERSGLR